MTAGVTAEVRVGGLMLDPREPHVNTIRRTNGTQKGQMEHVKSPMSLRQLQLESFRQRWEACQEHAPSACLKAPEHDWEFILVHELGQDKCDLYWRNGEDVYFLQILKSYRSVARAEGYYACWNKHCSPQMFYLLAVTSSEIDMRTIEGVMGHFEAYFRLKVFSPEDFQDYHKLVI